MIDFNIWMIVYEKDSNRLNKYEKIEIIKNN